MWSWPNVVCSAVADEELGALAGWVALAAGLTLADEGLALLLVIPASMAIATLGAVQLMKLANRNAQRPVSFQASRLWAPRRRQMRRKPLPMGLRADQEVLVGAPIVKLARSARGRPAGPVLMPTQCTPLATP